ncbi:Phosphoenolpyruvate carboxylase 1 [Ancistrocladus abbreviatus]
MAVVATQEYRLIAFEEPQFVESFHLVTGYKNLLEENPYLNKRLQLCDTNITTLNMLQAYTPRWICDPDNQMMVRP